MLEDGISWDSDRSCWMTHTKLPFLSGLTRIYIIPESEGANPSQAQAKVLESLAELPDDFIAKVDAQAEEFRNRSVSLLNDVLGDFPLINDMMELPPSSDSEGYLGINYQITDIVIPQLDVNSGQYFFLNAECDWDEEHGMMLLVRDGDIVHCGLQQMPYYIENDWLRHIC